MKSETPVEALVNVKLNVIEGTWSPAQSQEKSFMNPVTPAISLFVDNKASGKGVVPQSNLVPSIEGMSKSLLPQWKGIKGKSGNSVFSCVSPLAFVR